MIEERMGFSSISQDSNPGQDLKTSPQTHQQETEDKMCVLNAFGGWRIEWPSTTPAVSFTTFEGWDIGGYVGLSEPETI